ncbi:MAG: 2-phosphosulfolactate phosphatase [Pirellulales bacterium]|nr:2-phosphosulfolactate phosphatase [Pirellulales bacterium]
MPHILNVHSLPSLVADEELAGSVAVVIDVLRASTTIVTALASGAREILPCEDVDQARVEAARLPPETTLLGGERQAMPIDGFDLGNSPSEYSSEKVAGKTIVFTTTNGTRALARCHGASRILLGAFVNASAVLDALAGAERVHLVCAGTDEQMSYDDVLFAGMLVERLQQRRDMLYELNAQAITAGETWKHAFALPISLGAEPLPAERLAEKLQKSLGGESLVKAGLKEDILAAAQVDRYAIVPELNLNSGRVIASAVA